MAKGKVVIDRDRCKGCHMCIEVCPNGNLVVDKELNKKDIGRPASNRRGAKRKRAVPAAPCARLFVPM